MARGRKPSTETIANPAPEKLRLEYRTAAELADNPANWRTHPEPQLAALREVIDEVGWAGVCLFNERTGRLIDGHARKKIARADERIPVLVGSWTDEEEMKILLTLDPLGAMAGADKAALEALMIGVGESGAAVDAMLAGLAAKEKINLAANEPGAGGDEFDTTPEESGPTRTNVGELWIVGGVHRLLVGDCTVKENVDRLMGGEKAGLCFTSPPYAQQRDYGDAAKEKCKDWDSLMQGAFANLPMTDAGQVLVNLGLIHRDGEWVPYWQEWIEWMRAQGWRRFGWYVWDQGSGLPGDWNGRLAPSHEFVWHFNREAIRPEKSVAKKEENVGKRGHGTGMRGKDGKTKGMSSPELCEQPNKIPDSVIRVTRHMARGDEMAHPAVFPVAMAEFAISSWPADVYDPFLGSGTAMIAAHRLGRRCYGCELEPKYADVILRRCEAEGMTVELSK